MHPWVLAVFLVLFASSNFFNYNVILFIRARFGFHVGVQFTPRGASLGVARVDTMRSLAHSKHNRDH